LASISKYLLSTDQSLFKYTFISLCIKVEEHTMQTQKGCI